MRLLVCNIVGALYHKL